MATILVTGAAGQLGMEISSWNDAHPALGNNLITTDVADLDITDSIAVEKIMREQKVDFIVNCAAYTAVDKAESEPESAYRINVTGAEVLAKAAKMCNAALIHISTDYVFDGTNSIPYREDDPTSPLGVYGRTKLEGEMAIRNSGCRGIIIRTSWLYSEYGNNFVKTMMRLGAERDELRVVDDQWGSPTYAADLAGFIMGEAIAKLGGMQLRGEIYNYSNNGKISWSEFADEIMRLAGLRCKVAPVATNEYPTAARRPQYSLLDKSKVIKDFNITIPSWKDSLKRCITRICLDL